MKDKKWKEFERLTKKCYLSMVGMEKEDHGVWDQAFEVLKEIIANGRSKEQKYASELYVLDEDTDYEYDVQGWLEDYLDDLDMREDKEKLLQVCEELLKTFCWEEGDPSDIKLLKSAALTSLGRKEEAVEFCKNWLKEEPDNLTAVAANVYAFLEIRDMETCEKLITQHIHEDTECTDENDILFAAAVSYYKAAGNKKEMKRLDKAREEYDKLLSRFLFEDDGNWDDEDFVWDEDELPFS